MRALHSLLSAVNMEQQDLAALVRANIQEVLAAVAGEEQQPLEQLAGAQPPQ